MAALLDMLTKDGGVFQLGILIIVIWNAVEIRNLKGWVRDLQQQIRDR